MPIFIIIEHGFCFFAISRCVFFPVKKTQRLPGYMIRHFQPMSLGLGSNGIDGLTVGSLAEYVDIF